MSLQPIKATPTYERHRPEETTLYKLVQENWLTFQQQVESDMGYALPDFVVKEFESFLQCGWDTGWDTGPHGFLRSQCEKCHFER